MSLQNAKRLAEVIEQIDQQVELLSTKHQGFRKTITDQTMDEFVKYVTSNGFTVTDTQKGKKASYKDLNLELRPATEAFVGCYHSFDFIVNGKENFVRVFADLGKDSPPAPTAGTELEKREAELARLKEITGNIELQSYVFECGQKPKPGQKFQSIRFESITQAVDHFCA